MQGGTLRDSLPARCAARHGGGRKRADLAHHRRRDELAQRARARPRRCSPWRFLPTGRWRWRWARAAPSCGACRRGSRRCSTTPRSRAWRRRRCCRATALAPARPLPATTTAGSIALKPATAAAALQPRRGSAARCRAAAPSATSPARARRRSLRPPQRRGLRHRRQTGAIRCAGRTDGNSSVAGIQPLGIALVAAPVVSPSRNLAFFATRNLSGAREPRLRLRRQDRGLSLGLQRHLRRRDGRAAPGPGQRRRRCTTRSRASCSSPARALRRGPTLWAIDAGDTAPGAVVWSARLGDSDSAPAIADTAAPEPLRRHQRRHGCTGCAPRTVRAAGAPTARAAQRHRQRAGLLHARPTRSARACPAGRALTSGCRADLEGPHAGSWSLPPPTATCAWSRPRRAGVEDRHARSPARACRWWCPSATGSTSARPTARCSS